MMWAMTTAMRLVGDEEGMGGGGKGNGNGNVRVAGNEEGKGGKGRGVVDEGGMRRRGQWRQQRGRW
jgi:hypothetical protein